MSLPHAARPGFTLIEVLIAAVIGAAILALGIDQLYAFFRVQAQLLAKAELRHDAIQIQERISQKLRYALTVIPVPDKRGYILLIPTDVDRCGYICLPDIYDVLWWQVQTDPLHPGLSQLTEKRLVLPAFEPPADVEELLEVFSGPLAAGQIGQGRRLANAVDGLEIDNEKPGMFRTHVTASRALPFRKEKVSITLHEQVAARTQPVIKGIPPFAKMIAAWRKLHP